MNGLASMILRGRAAAFLATNAEQLSTHQQRLIVRLRGEASIGVFDQASDTLVVFDGAALVALASAEMAGAEEDDVVDVVPIDRCAGMGVVIDPPSRL